MSTDIDEISRCAERISEVIKSLSAFSPAPADALILSGVLEAAARFGSSSMGPGMTAAAMREVAAALDRVAEQLEGTSPAKPRVH